MTDLSRFLARGERARLFPVLADTSKEGRTLSIFLACLEHVDDFGHAMLTGLGRRVGKRSTIESYTEVVLQKNGDKNHRPDGLIVMKTGSSVWTALIEAKVGNSDLTSEQVEGYLELAKQNGIDTMLTLSNQFAPLPTHHLVQISAVARRKAELFHWSWMYVVTQASLLLSNGQIADPAQRFLLNEMVRFLTHPSAGVKSFDQMPAAWTDLVSRVQAGGAIPAPSAMTLFHAVQQTSTMAPYGPHRRAAISVTLHVHTALYWADGSQSKGAAKRKRLASRRAVTILARLSSAARSVTSRLRPRLSGWR
jgi:hypothetical protein